eukprot:5485495-Pyramimonas_sp.AAC.1
MSEPHPRRTSAHRNPAQLGEVCAHRAALVVAQAEALHGGQQRVLHEREEQGTLPPSWNLQRPDASKAVESRVRRRKPASQLVRGRLSGRNHWAQVTGDV